VVVHGTSESPLGFLFSRRRALICVLGVTLFDLGSAHGTVRINGNGEEKFSFMKVGCRCAIKIQTSAALLILSQMLGVVAARVAATLSLNVLPQ